MVSKRFIFEMQFKRMHCDPMELSQPMPVETTSSLRAHDALDFNFVSCQGFQSGIGSLGNGFCLNAMALLEQVDHACFTLNVANKFATYSHGAKLGFIRVKLDLKMRLPGVKLRHLIKDVATDGVHASDRQTTGSCSNDVRQVKGKNTDKLSELNVIDSGAAVVPFPSAISRS
jgi:hypothetical protein